MADKNRFLQQIRYFEKKYDQDLTEFKVKIEQDRNENFEVWDDLIQREATSACSSATIQKPEKVKDGNIVLAQ